MTLEMPYSNNIYELDFSTFQLPEGVVPQDMMYHIDNKMPRTLNVPILNTNNTISRLVKNSPIATLIPVGKCEQIQWVKWSEVTQEPNLLRKPQFLPEIPSTTNLQFEPDTSNVSKSTPDSDISEIARKRLQELLDVKYNSIVSKSAADIGRTNLIKLDILTEGAPVASKLYTLPLKYREFVDHEIKQLEEAGIISRSMSDWASPILVIPKKEEWVENSSDPSTATSPNKKFNLRLCIDYRKLNSHIVTARQIIADGSLGKVIFSYPLPTIGSLLARFNGCKSFSTIDLRSGYYHIQLTKEAAEKTAFITDKSKWIFHSLPFSISIGPSAFSYVLGKVLVPCTEFTLNYPNDIMIFSRTWEKTQTSWSSLQVTWSS